jgi:glutamate-ammonia-ligase adenylyltransferase
MEEISDVAEAVIDAALSRIRGAGTGERGGPAGRFCVLALGKLGGRELNYSSDIDLLALTETEGEPGAVEKGTLLMEELGADLSLHTTEGYAYRVDLRLRPYGTSGQLVFPLGSLVEYYRAGAALWELQALLKARPVAGDRELGAAFLEKVGVFLRARRERAEVINSINRLRREAVKGLSRGLLPTTDVKSGLGGIRDIEFLAQGLQLIHAFERPAVLRGGTLEALDALAACGVIPQETAGELSEDYLFLRRVEHFLQIYEDRQTHSLPRDPAEVHALARRMLGSRATAAQFRDELARRFDRVREICTRYLTEG